MRNLGFVMVLVACGSLALQTLGYDLLHARWADAAGESLGLALRIALIILGLALIVSRSSTFAHAIPRFRPGKR